MIDFKIEVLCSMREVLSLEGAKFIESWECPLQYSPSPLKTALIYLKVLSTLQGRYPALKNDIQLKSKITVEQVISILSALPSNILKRALLYQQDSEGNQVLDLIAQNLEILRELDDFISARLNYGDKYFLRVKNGHFLQTSVFFKHNKGRGDLEEQNTNGAIFYQFKIFRESVFIKNGFHVLFAFIVTLVTQWQSLRHTLSVFKYLEEFGELIVSGATQSQLFQYTIGAHSLVEELKVMILSTEPFILVMPAFFFNDLILRYLTPISSLHTFHFFILVIFFIMVSLFCFHYDLVFQSLNKYLTQPPLQTTISLAQKFTTDVTQTMNKLLGIGLFFYYLYILFSLRIFPFLSKLLVIFSHIILKLLPFIVLQIALLYVFTIVFCFSLNEIEVYRSQMSSFNVLIEAFFGNIDMGLMSDDGVLYSKVLIIFFMFVNALITTNMLIAVMLEDYNYLSHNSRPLYLRWVLSIQPYWASHPTHGFLTFKFGPLVVFSLFMSPFLCCKSKRINRTMELLLYLIPLILMTLVYLVADIFCFFWSVMSILSNKSTLSRRQALKDRSRKRKSRCVSCLCLTLCCPCTLVSDVVRFVKDAFSDPLSFSLPQSQIYSLPTLTLYEANVLIRTLKTIITTQLSPNEGKTALLVSSNQIVRSIRSHLIPQFSINTLYYSKQRGQEDDCFDSFSRVKRFIWQNSVHIEESPLLEPVALLHSLENLLLKVNIMKEEKSISTKQKNKSIYALTEAMELSVNSMQGENEDLRPQLHSQDLEGSGNIISGMVAAVTKKKYKIINIKIEEKRAQVKEELNFWN